MNLEVSAISPPPERGPGRWAIAGPGRVGQSLGLWAKAAGGRLVRVASRRPWEEARDQLDPSFRAALAADGTEWQTWESFSSADCDVLLLSVADPVLAPCAAELATRPQAPVVLHVAGSRDASILSALQPRSAIGSCHPLRAFPTVLLAPEVGTWYAVDGDAAALALARRLVEFWAGEAVELTGEARWLYHLAATLAAGGTTTLLAVVREILQVANLPAGLFDGYLRLQQGAIARLGGHSSLAEVEAVITGPAARRDRATLEAQRAALAAQAPWLRPVVEALQDEAWRRACGFRDTDPASG